MRREGEPTECALVNYATAIGHPKTELQEAEPRVDEIPFDSMRKMMSTLHKAAPDVGAAYVQYTKGAPDEVLKRCVQYEENGKVLPLTDEKRAQILAENKRMADKALRVLAAS